MTGFLDGGFAPSTGADIGDNIANSLRFRASNSANLTRQNTASGDRRKATLSLWLKPGVLSTNGTLGDGPHIWMTGDSMISGGLNEYCRLLLTGPTGNQLVMQSLGSAGETFTSTPVFRDFAKPYHIVVSWDCAANLIRCYVQGAEITYASRTNPTNIDALINKLNAWMRFGIFTTTEHRSCDGVYSAIHWIDGQALAPTAFGRTSADTGAWVPKNYTGTYGANGFKLDFSNGTSLTTLGYDSSGNNNHWTLNNFSLTAGATYDWLTDTPTNTFAALNPLNPSRSTLTNANLTASGSTDLPTLAPDSGTWYFERNGTAQTWTPPASFPSGSGDYNFGQRPWQSTGPTGGQKALCTANLPDGETITTSGTFTGNASVDGPYVDIKGVPLAMTINGNAVTFGTHADKTAMGFKVRSSSASYNSAGSNIYSITSSGVVRKYSNAQGNP